MVVYVRMAVIAADVAVEAAILGVVVGGSDDCSSSDVLEGSDGDDDGIATIHSRT